MITVYIVEEEGLAYWRWDYPGTVVELIQDWKQGKAPSWYGCSTNYRGKLVELLTPEAQGEALRGARARANLHMPEDTYLRVDSVVYPAPRIGSTR